MGDTDYVLWPNTSTDRKSICEIQWNVSKVYPYSSNTHPIALFVTTLFDVVCNNESESMAIHSPCTLSIILPLICITKFIDHSPPLICFRYPSSITVSPSQLCNVLGIVRIVSCGCLHTLKRVLFDPMFGLNGEIRGPVNNQSSTVLVWLVN